MSGLAQDEPAMLARLAASLRRMTQQSLRHVGCACCGRGPVRIDQAMIEDDLLGFLADRYRATGETHLAAAVERWIGTPGAIFSGFAGDDRVAPDGGPVRRRILHDLLVFAETQDASDGPREG